VANKTIKLDTIQHSEFTTYKAIGVSAEEWKNCLMEVHRNSSPAQIIRKLGFNLNEIQVVIENFEKMTQVVAILWKLEGKDQISLQDFVETVTVLRHFFRFKQVPIIG